MPVPDYFCQPINLETLATYIWDLNAIPRQRTFELLSLNCDDELEKEKLIEFTTPEGLEDLYNYTYRPKRTILEVLGDFPHAVSNLTLPVLFELFQHIKPRSFSIASSKASGLLEILVAVVEYKTILSTKRRGLCSNWLKDLIPGETIFGSVKLGTFNIPKDDHIPILMVGPGTGVAPFRSLLMERECISKDYDKNMILFFGCRSAIKDFHCKSDFVRMQNKGLVKCFYAFSRDQEHKIYVQHKIEEQKDLIGKIILEQNGVILVAGSSKNMPLSVKEAFAAIVDMDYIENMIKTKRYQEETWS